MNGFRRKTEQGWCYRYYNTKVLLQIMDVLGKKYTFQKQIFQKDKITIYLS